MQSCEETWVFGDPSSYVDGEVGVSVVDAVVHGTHVVGKILSFRVVVVVEVAEDVVGVAEDAVEVVVVAWDVDVSTLGVVHGIDLE